MSINHANRAVLLVTPINHAHYLYHLGAMHLSLNVHAQTTDLQSLSIRQKVQRQQHGHVHAGYVLSRALVTEIFSLLYSKHLIPIPRDSPTCLCGYIMTVTT